jgi:hypothetical protein
VDPGPARSWRPHWSIDTRRGLSLCVAWPIRHRAHRQATISGLPARSSRPLPGHSVRHVGRTSATGVPGNMRSIRPAGPSCRSCHGAGLGATRIEVIGTLIVFKLQNTRSVEAPSQTRRHRCRGCAWRLQHCAGSCSTAAGGHNRPIRWQTLILALDAYCGAVTQFMLGPAGWDSRPRWLGVAGEWSGSAGSPPSRFPGVVAGRVAAASRVRATDQGGLGGGPKRASDRDAVRATGTRGRGVHWRCRSGPRWPTVRCLRTHPTRRG